VAHHHLTINSIHIFIFIAIIIHCQHYTCKLDVLTLYSLVLMSASGGRFIAETCRSFNVYGRFVSLYKFCAFVRVKGDYLTKIIYLPKTYRMFRPIEP